MRAIWTGAITFGLVSVPVKLYAATEDHDVHLHQVHDADGGRIRYQRRCEVCGNVVAYEDIDKAFEEGGTTVVLTEEDLSALPEERSREIEVVEFVPADQVDPIRFERSYFLEPDRAAAKAYALLRQTLEKTDRTAIVQFSLRQKTRLAALRPRDKVLMLQTLLWDDEVREADFPVLDTTVRVSGKEMEMAASLVENLSADFAPDQFSDEYQAQLKELIRAKLEQGDALDTAATFGEEEAEGPKADVVDLMEALRRSVEANRAKRAGAQPGADSARSGSGTGSGGKATARKTSEKSPAKTAKKSPPRKTAAKKGPAKKGPAKQTGAKKSASKPEKKAS